MPKFSITYVEKTLHSVDVEAETYEAAIKATQAKIDNFEELDGEAGDSFPPEILNVCEGDEIVWEVGDAPCRT